jgi:hypothetical protein
MASIRGRGTYRRRASRPQAPLRSRTSADDGSRFQCTCPQCCRRGHPQWGRSISRTTYWRHRDALTAQETIWQDNSNRSSSLNDSESESGDDEQRVQSTQIFQTFQDSQPYHTSTEDSSGIVEDRDSVHIPPAEDATDMRVLDYSFSGGEGYEDLDGFGHSDESENETICSERSFEGDESSVDDISDEEPLASYFSSFDTEDLSTGNGMFPFYFI